MTKNKNRIKKFFMIVGSIVGAYVMISAVIAVTMIATQGGLFNAIQPVEPSLNNPIVDNTQPESENKPTSTPQNATPTPTDDDGFLKPMAKTNFLIYGMDQSSAQTDVLMVGCFDRDTCEINILSIPRDLYTRIPEERLNRMRENGLHPPSSGVMKINALRSYGGRTYGVDYLKEQLGEMLGIQIHYYVEMNLEAFRKIVDLLGGVEMEIPSGGLYYDDPEQNLHIAIPAGMQRLNGEAAEGVVRFRHTYPNGDLDRINVQHEFIKQLFRQTLKRETIMRDPLGIANLIINYIKTDIGLEVVKYAPYAGSISAENIHFYTLPGEGTYINDISYFLPDSGKVSDVVNRVFYAAPATVTPTPVIVDAASKDLRIQILNGSRIAGLASAFADTLSRDGYQILDVNNYSGTQENQTRIMVRTAGMGNDLLPYFNNAVIKEDASISAAYDIVIIIGKREA